MTDVNKTKKNIFIMVYAGNEVQQQQNTITYGIDIARLLQLNVIIYVDVDGKLSFHEGVKSVRALCRTPKKQKANAKEPKISFCRERMGFTRSIDKIISRNSAELVVLGMRKTKTSIFGTSILDMVQKIHIPTVLVAENAHFLLDMRFILAADDFNKVQKLNLIDTLSKLATSMTVTVFKKNAPSKQGRIDVIANTISNRLHALDIPSDIDSPEEPGDFSRKLIRYAIENFADLLLEIDKGDIPGAVKKNLNDAMAEFTTTSVWFVSTDDKTLHGRF